MTELGVGRWGKYLEAELTDLELVVMHALTCSPTHEPSAWVRGRDAKPLLFATDRAVHEFVNETWIASMAFFWREVPSISLVTDHGRVVITDLWGDTQYRMLRRHRGRSLMQPGMPLIRVADAIAQMGVADRSSVVVTVAADGEVEALLPRARLHAWSSYASPAGAGFAWVAEANDDPRAGARSVLREFLRAH